MILVKLTIYVLYLRVIHKDDEIADEYNENQRFSSIQTPAT